MNLPLILAQATTAAPATGGAAQSPIAQFFPLIIMVVIFYFLLLRPQQRKEKERRAMLAQVKTGDRVVFGGGLIGVVSNTADRKLTIKIADNVKVDVLRGAVTNVLAADDDLANATV